MPLDETGGFKQRLISTKVCGLACLNDLTFVYFNHINNFQLTIKVVLHIIRCSIT